MTEETSSIRVECYAGHRGEETPRRFWIVDREIAVAEVLDRWLAPDHRYFRVRGDDGDIYILRHDSAADRWDMTMFLKRDSDGPGSGRGLAEPRVPGGRGC